MQFYKIKQTIFSFINFYKICSFAKCQNLTKLGIFFYYFFKDCNFAKCQNLTKLAIFIYILFLWNKNGVSETIFYKIRKLFCRRICNFAKCQNLTKLGIFFYFFFNSKNRKKYICIMCLVSMVLAHIFICNHSVYPSISSLYNMYHKICVFALISNKFAF